MKPLGRCALYIVDRTDLAALATTGADISIDSKLLVGNHAFVKILADDIGEEARCHTLVEFLDASFTVFDDTGHVLYLSPGLINLLLFPFLCVGIHKGQADIAFGHDDREQRLGLQTLAGQFTIEDLHRLSRAVTTGGQCPDKGVVMGVERSTADEVADDSWRLPTVCREAESQSFTVIKLVVELLLLKLVRDALQLVTASLGQLLGYPFRIACS